jgi:hypothetical protein
MLFELAVVCVPDEIGVSNLGTPRAGRCDEELCVLRVQPMPHFAENPDRDFSAGYADIEQQRAATTQHEPDPDVRQRICADLLRVV